ncbi:hypothetical protein CTAYLR_009921 [Chrysophaeum taylorii]|uniref:Adenylate cyclase n=1 Tax=Chrysophaeum taylorii TaxID=2483200 RepID=A0AAD7XP19_9STRA|nr:hypothetical protein CTAYLR_009921 [Chrysophaeum taylorii]
MPFEVAVDVLSARNLIAVDEDGTSDPFVTVQLLAVSKGRLSAHKVYRKTKSTKEKRRTLSPVFRSEDNNAFQFTNLSELPVVVAFRVMDWNRWASPKPMGEFSVRIEEPGASWTKFYGLKAPRGETMSSFLRRSSSLVSRGTLGEVEVRVSVTSSRQRSRRPSFFASGRGLSTSRKAPDGWAAAAELEAGKKWFDASVPSREPNVLRVAVVGASGLEPRRSSSADPFAVVRYRGTKRSTRVERRTLEPVWATTLDFARPKDGGSDVVTVEVCDARTFSERKRLGKAQADCSSSRVQATALDLDTHGAVTLAWKLAYDPIYDETADSDWFSSFLTDDDAAPDDARPDEVHVVVVRARGLRAADAAVFGEATSDPYVKLRVLKSSESIVEDSWAQTEVVKKDLAPVWNARFALRLGDDDDEDEAAAAAYRLCLEVFDRDFLSSDDFLGRAYVDLAKTVKQERARTATAEWIPLEGDDATGEILVATKTHCSSKQPVEARALEPTEDLALPAQPAAPPRPARLSWRPFSSADDVASELPNELRVGLKRAAGLWEEDLDAAVSVVFSVLRREAADADAAEEVVLEWQSRQARLFRAPAAAAAAAADPADGSVEATFQQAFAWPLLPTRRDDEYFLSATLTTVGGAEGPQDWALRGSVPLADVVKDRPKVETLDLDLAAAAAAASAPRETNRHRFFGDTKPVLQLAVQWRHNRCLADITPLAERLDDDDDKEDEKKDDNRRRRSSFQSIVKHRILGVNNFLKAKVNQSPDALYAYAAFVPACVLKEVAKRRADGGSFRRLQALEDRSEDSSIYGRAMRSETKADAAVLFADISGFTKLTEKLNARLNGAELLCAELDVVYGALCEEADALGGDAVKFAGDAICFVWVVEGTERGGVDLSEATRRAALCARRAHSRVRRHPAVEGVKLTLHAGLSAGPLTLLSITRERPAGQRQRAEFIVAGVPLEQIGVAEPLAGPGETVCSPRAWTYLEAAFEGAPPLTKTNPLPEKAAGYKRIGGLLVDEEELVAEPPMPLMAATVQDLEPSDVECIAPFVPRAFDRILRSKHATATFVEHAKHAKAEIRELTVAFLSFEGVNVAEEPDRAQELVSCVDWATRNYDGSINKFIIDDKGTLAVIVFGLPTSVHENAATRCLAAIRLLQENLPSLGMSCWVGITTARTFCGAVGSRRRMEYTVMGDSVNLAARLMAACGKVAARAENAVIVAEATRAATQVEIEYEVLEPIFVKGKEHAVEIFAPIPWGAQPVKMRRSNLPRSLSSGMRDRADVAGVRFESHRAKLGELEDVFDDVFSRKPQHRPALPPPPPPPPSSSSTTPPLRRAESTNALGITTCVLRAVDGTSASMELTRCVPALCRKRGVALLRTLASRSIYDDGVLKATTLCGAWRGPVVSAIDIIAAADDDEELATLLAADNLPSFGSGLGIRQAQLERVLLKTAPGDVETIRDMFLPDEMLDDATTTEADAMPSSSSGLPPPPPPPAAAAEILGESDDPRRSMWHTSLRLLQPVVYEKAAGTALLRATRTAAASSSPSSSKVRDLPAATETTPDASEEGVARRTTSNLSKIQRIGRVASLVVELVLTAACHTPICILLDNLLQMDAASWEVVHLLSRGRRKGDGTSATVVPRYPVLLCLLAPLTRDEGVHRAEWLEAKALAELGSTLVDVTPLEPDESMLLAAETLGLCKSTDDDETRREAKARLEALPHLAAYVHEAGGVRDVLCSMLEDAITRRAIEVEVDDQGIARVAVLNHNLGALPPPEGHAAIALAAIDDALPIQDQLVLKAASAFKSAFTPTLLHNLAPINIEPRHVKDLCVKLCAPLESGKTIFKKRKRDDWYSKLTAAGSPANDLDADLFEFRETLLQKAVADTLLDSQIRHVMEKTDTLPIAGLKAKSWAVELLHPFILRKFNQMRQQSTRLRTQSGSSSLDQQLR